MDMIIICVAHYALCTRVAFFSILYILAIRTFPDTAPTHKEIDSERKLYSSATRTYTHQGLISIQPGQSNRITGKTTKTFPN